MLNIRKFLEGLRILPKTTLVSDSKGELEVLNSDGTLNYHNGTTRSAVTTASHSATLTNKTIDADSNTITNIDDGNIKALAAIDATKIADGSVDNTEFQYLDGVTSNIQDQLDGKTSSTLTDAHILVGNASNEATDVAVSGDLTLTNTGNFQIATGVIVNADINASAAIDASKIHNGSVSNTEFGYLDGVTSGIQGQLDGKINDPGTVTDEAIVRFDGTTGTAVQNSVVTISNTGDVTGIIGLEAETFRVYAEHAEEVHFDSTTTGANADVALASPIIRLSNVSLTSIDSISTPVAGEMVTLLNQTGNPITINDNTGGGFAILTGTQAPIQLPDQAGITLKYDNFEAKWVVIGGTGSGGGGSSLDTVFQLIGNDVAQWSTGNNATFLGGGTLGGTFAANTSTPMHGSTSYLYTQAGGSLNDYIASPAQTVDRKFRGQVVTIYHPYTLSTGSLQLRVYDVTNAALIPLTSTLATATSTTTFKTNFTIPLTCTSIRIGYQVTSLSSGSIFSFDDVQVTSDTTVMADIFDQVQSLKAASVSGSTVNLSTGAMGGSGLFTVSGTTLTASKQITINVGLSIQATSAALGDSTSAAINGSSGGLNTADISRASAASQTIRSSCSLYAVLQQGDSLTFSGSTSGSPTSITNSYTIVATASSEALLTAPETFSTDTAPLTYAGSATYTLSTLANAPVGTFITFTYAINTNTRTQTNASAPTQTTSSMNTNGIQMFTRAYNAASTAAQPALVAIQIGKGMKGLNLNIYSGTGKDIAGSFDYLLSGTTSQFGARSREYNEVTGVLLIDLGTAPTTVTTSQIIYSDQSLTTTGYVTINASKNPALTGLNISGIAARGVNTAGTSVANTGSTVVPYNSTKTYDTNGALDTTTGVFTAPEAGYYTASWTVTFSAQTYAVGNVVYSILQKNSSDYAYGTIVTIETATSFQINTNGSSGVFLLAGETLRVITGNSRTAGATTLNTGTGTNFFSIHKTSVG